MIRPKRGKLEVWVYDPAAGRKVYIGTYAKRGTLKEDGTAKWAERRAEAEFAEHRRHTRETVRSWSARWQAEYPRPETTSNENHRSNLRILTREFGDRPLHELTKTEAYRIAQQRPHVAKTASAMYNDAIRFLEGFDGPNPFTGLIADREGRRNIEPLTETEVRRLAEISVEEHGVLFGTCFAAWILFAGWTGCRPGELAGMRWTDLDFDAMTVSVQRQRRKDGLRLPKTKQTRTIVLPSVAADAVRGMPVRDIEWLFTTQRGLPFQKGSWNYYWGPISRAFQREQPATHWLPQRVEMDPTRTLDLYELRHFCGSLMADRGASARDISEQLGNSERVCEETYIHPYRDRVLARNRAVFEQPEHDAEKPRVETRQETA